jgi:hypothetical protein
MTGIVVTDGSMASIKQKKFTTFIVSLLIHQKEPCLFTYLSGTIKNKCVCPLFISSGHTEYEGERGRGTSGLPMYTPRLGLLHPLKNQTSSYGGCGSTISSNPSSSSSTILTIKSGPWVDKSKINLWPGNKVTK